MPLDQRLLNFFDKSVEERNAMRESQIPKDIEYMSSIQQLINNSSLLDFLEYIDEEHIGLPDDILAMLNVNSVLIDEETCLYVQDHTECIRKSKHKIEKEREGYVQKALAELQRKHFAEKQESLEKILASHKELNEEMRQLVQQSESGVNDVVELRTRTLQGLQAAELQRMQALEDLQAVWKLNIENRPVMAHTAEELAQKSEGLVQVTRRNKEKVEELAQETIRNKEEAEELVQKAVRRKEKLVEAQCVMRQCNEEEIRTVEEEYEKIFRTSMEDLKHRIQQIQVQKFQSTQQVAEEKLIAIFRQAIALRKPEQFAESDPAFSEERILQAREEAIVLRQQLQQRQADQAVAPEALQQPLNEDHNMVRAKTPKI